MRIIILVLLLILPSLSIAAPLLHSDKIQFIDSIRIDIECNIPTSLLLVQAIIESDWGRSRYNRTHNNLFGLEQQTDGIWVPIKFDKPTDSIREYIRLLNKGKHFLVYRDIRKVTNDSHVLTYGLESYSILGKEYIKRLQDLIRIENLKDYD